MFVDNNNKKSSGALITYSLGKKGNIGYSNYTGDDSPIQADSIKKRSHLRIHNNIFWNHQFGKFKIQLGGDFCVQQNSDTTGKGYATMFSGLIASKFEVRKKLGVYARAEIFRDPHGFMSGIFIERSGRQTGLEIMGATAGIEYTPTENSYVRLEGRRLQTDPGQEIFRWRNDYSENRTDILLNIGLTF